MALTVMVVDDEPEAVKFLKSVIGPLGHEVVTFSDSREAAERSEKQKFDVVFMDMRMPELDGLGLTRRIRGSKQNTDTAIVMLTGVDQVENLREAFKEGVTLFLTKPVTPARLTSLLTAMERTKWKDKRHSARLPLLVPVNCTCGDQQLAARSANISESGILVQPAAAWDIGQEVLIEFTIFEIRASLKVRAKIVRQEGKGSMGLQFIDLAPEHRNAIQLYIMGRMKK